MVFNPPSLCPCVRIKTIKATSKKPSASTLACVTKNRIAYKCVYKLCLLEVQKGEGNEKGNESGEFLAGITHPRSMHCMSHV